MLQDFRAAQATEAPPSVGKCVLIVEDNLLNMKMISAMLAAEGYRVLEASDGPSGLALAQSRHPDLIVMDVNLPGMSGIEVTQSLKADLETSDIPILVTTAYEKQFEEDIRRSGCDGFMAKPIGVSEFLDAVELFSARRQLRPV